MGDRVSTARLTPRTNVFNHNTTLKERILILIESNGIEPMNFEIEFLIENLSLNENSNASFYILVY